MMSRSSPSCILPDGHCTCLIKKEKCRSCYLYLLLSEIAPVLPSPEGIELWPSEEDEKITAESKKMGREFLLEARGARICWSGCPLVMGIVNLSSDSFSGDGLSEPTLALHYAQKIVAQGADIVDIGGESARTNRAPISEEEEIRRMMPFVEGFSEVVANSSGHSPLPLLSINTWRPNVARAILNCGGHILNDVGGLTTGKNASVCAETGAALVIMHSRGAPKVSHRHVHYSDIMRTLQSFFLKKIRMAEQSGVKRNSLLLDPGIDFAKQRNDNLTIYRKLRMLSSFFPLPLLLPVSRKSVIGEVLGLSKPCRRDAGTVSCVVAGLLRGAAIFRVHNVRAAVHTIRTIYPMLTEC